MRWFNIKRKDLVGLERINGRTNKHILRLSPNSKNLERSENDDSDTRYLVAYINRKPNLRDVKDTLIALQKDYDKSREVNSFYVNSKRDWFDVNTRVGLRNSINIEKETGKDITTIWFSRNNSITVNVNKALNFINDVELYAKKCNDVTRNHIAEINSFTTIEECLAFDITKDYPEILNIILD